MSTPTRLDIAQAYVAIKAKYHLKHLVVSLHRAQNPGTIMAGLSFLGPVPPNEAGKDRAWDNKN